MVRRQHARVTLKRMKEVDREYQAVETDFKYWLHHILHWHALLVAVVAVLSFGYFSL